MRLGIVGCGLAGALLAWRLSHAPHHLRPDVFVGNQISGVDATDASGGLTRAFELDQIQCLDAAESLAELLADPLLRAWAGYREVGSVFALPDGADPAESLAIVATAVPGSLRVATRRELPATHPLGQLPGDPVFVIEARAGYISPSRLRASAMTSLAAKGLLIRPGGVSAVLPGPSLQLADGTVARYDRIVLAAGAWTPSLLRRSGLPTGGLRTKQIQYALASAQLRGVGTFVDATSGLYGRPDGTKTFLLGLPCERWDAAPGAAIPDAELAARVLRRAALCFPPGINHEAAARVVAAVECYSHRPGLQLRSVIDDAPVYTFTGGSGIAAKAALASSRVAALALVS